MTPEEIILDILRDAARKGERCPTNGRLRVLAKQRGLTNGVPVDCIPSELAHRGLCRSEVYSQNWRVVEIDGMRTQECPRGGEPYKVIDRRRKP